ncbi:Imm1 family immunity protein [Streptoalloteichus tenebrarius]
MALRAWYDPDNDHEPIAVTTTADADAFLDRLAHDRAAMQVPPLMQLSRRDPDGWAVLHVGINTDRGILTYTDATGSYVTTNNTTATNEPLTYDYMGHVRQVPGNAELPLADVCKAVHEFVTTGGARPTCVQWQPDQ